MGVGVKAGWGGGGGVSARTPLTDLRRARGSSPAHLPTHTHHTHAQSLTVGRGSMERSTRELEARGAGVQAEAAALRERFEASVRAVEGRCVGAAQVPPTAWTGEGPGGPQAATTTQGERS